MFKPVAVFSGFSVGDFSEAKRFYTETLGLEVKETMGGGEIIMPGGARVWVYPKPNHEPATYTVLNFVVDSVDEAVDDLTSRGVQFERYEDMPMQQDEKGIVRGAPGEGPTIAWFKDPAGNVFSVLEEAV
jgi:catechol 2,3-dioxygenase-like lactoylglutathione lyase family enzyme